MVAVLFLDVGDVQDIFVYINFFFMWTFLITMQHMTAAKY